MAQIGADSAESRASKILHGLGFTEAMQVGGAPATDRPRTPARFVPSLCCLGAFPALGLVPGD